jgi:hypothetical protein
MKTLLLISAVVVGLTAMSSIAAERPKQSEPILLGPVEPPKEKSPDGYEGMIIEIAPDGTIQLDAQPMPDLAELDRRLARWATSVKYISPRIVLDSAIPSNNLKRLREIILVIRKHTEVYDVLVR